MFPPAGILALVVIILILVAVVTVVVMRSRGMTAGGDDIDGGDGGDRVSGKEFANMCAWVWRHVSIYKWPVDRLG
jgi:preprotein translocase subunit SecG